MSVSVNWATKVITIPQADLTSLGGGIYEFDLDAFRLELKGIEDSEEGIVFLDTHRHNTTVTVGGLTLARVIEFINGYTITFEDGQYAVNAIGANSNLADVMNVNQVSLRSFNSAGLIVVSGAVGDATQAKQDAILSNLGVVDTVTDAIKERTDNLPDDPATETKQDTIISDIELLENVSLGDISTTVESASLAALGTYDGPTRTEATSDKDEILADIAAVDANVDILITRTAELLGLSQKNYRISNSVYATYGTVRRMTSAAIKIYPTAADVDADTNEISAYTVAATYNATGDMTDYRVKLV